MQSVESGCGEFRSGTINFMKPSTMHFGGIFLQIAGVVMLIAGKTELIPGPIGFYSGITSGVLGVILHAFNTPNGTTPPPM